MILYVYEKYATIIENTSIQNTYRDKYLHHDNLQDSITKNDTIGFDYKVSKEYKFQSILQDLLYSSYEATVFVYDLPIDDDHCELQKQFFQVLIVIFNPISYFEKVDTQMIVKEHHIELHQIQSKL